LVAVVAVVAVVVEQVACSNYQSLYLDLFR
jgi:hypothetical protein